jgi:hypothetical protein
MTFISTFWNQNLSAFCVAGQPYKKTNKKQLIQQKNLTKIDVWK